LTGWGSISDDVILDLPDKLQAAELPIIPIEECIQMLKTQDTPIDDSMVCTGPAEGGKGSCKVR